MRTFAVPPVVPNHLLTRARDMRAHGREPLRGIEDLSVFSVFRRIEDHPFIGEIPHPFLGKGCPDYVPCQVLQCRFLLRRDAVTAEYMESGMAPPCEHCLGRRLRSSSGVFVDFYLVFTCKQRLAEANFASTLPHFRTS
jgi:hypothetical protein